MASQRFACGFENAPHLGRISPIFRDLQGLGPADPIVAAQEMEEAVGERPGISYAVEATEYCLKQCRRNPDPKGFLAPEDAATIKLYTSEDETQPNLYSEMNARCYSSERNRFLFPCKKYMWNLLHALKKLPPYEKGTVVNRGVKKALVTEEPEKYKKGQVLTWWGFSSCTKDADVLRNPQFMGTTGPRTLFNIELTQHIARDISDYSLLPEGEVLLPPGVTFEIASILDAGSGLHMVCLKEIEPDDIILELRQRTHSGGQTIMHAQATAASSLAASKVAPPAAKPTHTRPLASAAVPAADLYLPGGTRGVGATVIGQTDAKDSQADKDGARDRRDDRGGDNSDRRYRSRSRGGRRSRSNRRGGRSRSNRRDGGRQRGRWSRSPRRAEPAKPRRNTGFTSAPADPSQAPYHAPSPAPSPAPPIGKAFEEVAGLLNISVQELKAHREIHLYRFLRSMTDDHVKEIAQHCHNLKKIDLYGIQVTDAGVQEIATNCPRLHTIDLQSTKVTDQGVQELAKNCRELRQISLNGTKVTDAGIQELAKNCRELTAIYLSGTKVTDAGIQELKKNCPKLTFLRDAAGNDRV